MELKQEKPAVGADGLHNLAKIYHMPLIQQKQLVVVTLQEFLARTLPPRETILDPWLMTQSLNMIYS